MSSERLRGAFERALTHITINSDGWEVWGEHDRNIDQPLVVADLILGGTQ